MKLLTAEQMRQLDQQAIATFGIPSVVLMENAGRTTYQILRREFPHLTGMVVIVAGRGNNGGDGFVVGRYLAQDGFGVKVLLLAEQDQVQGDARINLEILNRLKVPVIEVITESAFVDNMDLLRRAELVVDGILGTGLNSDVTGLYRTAIEAINDLPVAVLAIDIPSGLSADSGQPWGMAVQADVTVTYGWPKLGQILPPGRDWVGRLWQVDISIPPSLLDISKIELAEARELRSLLPPRPFASHKGSYGHLLIVAGSEGKTGAATLTAQGALRVGAGLVTVGIPSSLNDIMEVKLTEAMTVPLPEVKGNRALGSAALSSLETIGKGKSAIAVGPGLGTHPETRQLVRDLIRRTNIPLVVDADGINALAEDLSCLESIQAPIILTPHPGEMSRLLGRSTGEIQGCRPAAAQDFSRRHGITLVLKGSQTVISDPEGRTYINNTGNPNLAAGGTGDVLTGMIAGFMAQKLPAFDAARLGVYLHGLVADQLMEKKGDRGVLAGELLETLPAVITKFTLGRMPQMEEEEICYRRVIS